MALSSPLEYGSAFGDSYLIGDDLASTKLRSATQVFVGDGSDGGFSSVYVGTNGIIGMGERYNSLSINEMNSAAISERQIICPFWTDLTSYSYNGDSAVYYQAYSRGFRSQHSALLRANAIVKEFYSQDFPNFETSWLVKVTWKDMALYADRSQKVTIQCLLISDGENTFVVFNYIDVNLRPIRNLRISIGYRFKRFLARNSYSNQQAAFRMSSVPGNRGTNGFWIYKMTTEVRLSREERECFSWYLRNKESGVANRLSNMAWSLQCPCDSGLLRFDPRFSFSRIDYRNNVMCYATMTFGRNAECCYPFFWWSSWWWWWWRPVLGSCRRSPPVAGTLMEYNPFFQRFNHYNQDVRPKDICCNSGHCDWYYEVRPITRCYRRSPFRAAWFFGDPHIGTLDGHQYTFNGYGEYTMMKIDTEETKFELQARTDLATNENGTTINATIFSAFAAKDQTGATVQIEMSRNKDKMYIRGDDRDLTREFENLNYTYTTQFLQLRQENQTIVASFLNSSITIKVSLGVRFLTCEAVVDDVYKGNVSGLMGNFDGNTTNDFLLPNGTTLTGNSTGSERAIYFNFGQAWSVNDTTSIFHYDTGLSHEDYNHPDFLPFFIDEFSDERRNKAKEQCGGASASQSCIFDFLATGDKTLAISSGSEESTSESETSAIANETPEVIGDSVIEAEVNVTVKLKFNISDDGENAVYKILQQPNTNFQFDNLTGIASWTPYDTNVTSISVSAVDNQQVESSPLDIAIILCSGCNGNGKCNYTNTRNSENELFKRATCECKIGYSGDDCEQDVDGCEDYPCPLGRNCTDLTPEQEAAQNRSYTCSDCPGGFRDIDNKCEDINECNGTVPVCNDRTENCENTEGGYTCNCLSGYRKVGLECLDIDECLESTSGCAQLCNNTEGSFICSCLSGFKINQDNKTCYETETDKCKKANLTCEYTCVNSSGFYECICQNGYKLEANEINCTDVDECKLGICAQDCVNTVGSYSCSCFTGFTLNDDRTTCSECIPPNYGDNCEQVCECGPGMDRCDSVTGCVCLSGWTGTKCDQDIDECAVNPLICGTDKECQNLQGSYMCNCRNGFEKINEICKDIDECANDGSNECPISSTCLNNDGNYTCQCNEGYTQKSTYECQDIDECKTGVAGCSQNCSNVEGGFNCECEFGYTLEDDRKTCAVVTDICSLYPHLNCSFGCRQDPANKTFGYCFCGAGFYLNAMDERSCVDVNECGDDALNLCTFKENCVNTVGSYNCSCPIGYILENDGRQCSVCDSFHYGLDCKIPCNCGVGASTCDNVQGCQCRTGWAGLKCDADMDECTIGNPCNGANQICQNTPGSYRCLCETGYNETLPGQCTDINECINKPCDQICNNTNGGYTCSCNPGFKLTNQSKCEDIDECSAPVSPCDQLCSNTPGSYRCFCREGFLLNVTTKSNCHAKTECTVLNCTQQCAVRADGSEFCSCRNGFSLDSDNITCTDIDDCSQNPCSENCTQNGPGLGYTCSCDVGKKLDIDQRTCIECENGYYGINCNDECSCKSENTASCDRITGSCTCKEGWNGTFCNDDVNECLKEHICPNNSDCKNLNGSYSCDCKDGFSFAGEQCVECSSTTYGQNCANQCACEFSNTQSCDKQNGTCYCSSGWQGINCTEDVPECTNDPNICGSNASCNETNGSYFCLCDPGFHKTSAGHCENIDECALGIGNCSQNAICSDTEGSFMCKCRPGFQGNGYNCTGCNGTSYGEQCSKACSCDIIGTSKCDNIDGTCTCKDGWNGTNCELTNECETGANNCHMNASCQDTEDSYNCSCNIGFYGDGVNCTVCNQTTYGEQCSKTCSCNFAGTIDCDNIDGTCTCKDGFTGTNCEFTDECDTGVHNCHMNASCQDTVDSYNCSCNIGFYGDGVNCTGCNKTTYGEKCSKTCSCYPAGTTDCDNVGGKCTCKDGFNGTNCEFTDECNTRVHNCHMNASCQDTEDSYNCSCNIGFYGDGVNCTACNDWTYGNQCSQNCTCNTENTADCDDTTGACICKTEWNGTNCDVRVDDCRNGTAVCDITLQECLINNGTSSYSCYCLYGANSSGDCLSQKPPYIHDSTVETKFQAEMTLAIIVTPQEFENNTKNITDTIFQSLIRHFEDEIRGFKTLIILSIRRGSIIVQYEIVVYKNESSQGQISDYIKATTTLLSIFVEFKALGRNASIDFVTIFDEEGTAFIVNKSSSPCGVLKQYRPCSDGETCVENLGVPSCVPIEVTDYFDLIVGLGIGIPLAVTVIAIIFIICVYCKRRADKEDLTAYSDTDDRSRDGSEFFRSRIPVRYGSWGHQYSPWGLEGTQGIENDTPRARKYEQDILNQENIDDRPIPYNSEFSWDFLHASIPPTESFRIERPKAERSPHPLFREQSTA